TKTVWLHADETVAAPPANLQLGIRAYRPLSNGGGVHNNILRGMGGRLDLVPSGQEAYIRYNGDDDDKDGIDDHKDPDVRLEDDLIPIQLDFGTQVKPDGVRYYEISKNNDNVRVWNGGPAKLSGPGGYRILLDKGENSAPLFFPMQQGAAANGNIRLWVEWIAPPTEAANNNSTVITFTARDAQGQVIGQPAQLTFRAYTSMVVVFGGKGQMPEEYFKYASNYGTYRLALDLYREHGYDVYAYLPNPGSSAALEEIRIASQKRGVRSLGIIGYSWGGGLTYELSTELVSLQRDGRLPLAFDVDLTAYIDAVRFKRASPEERPPLWTRYHMNFYQVSLTDLHGARMQGPGPYEELNLTGLHDHYTIDDEARLVHSRIKERLSTYVRRP
ncbi:MAG: hypothetical protein QW570_08535, partial [Candidatus Caldarchaeum sp.]